jgi:hypothetical protein
MTKLGMLTASRRRSLLQAFGAVMVFDALEMLPPSSKADPLLDMQTFVVDVSPGRERVASV